MQAEEPVSAAQMVVGFWFVGAFLVAYVLPSIVAVARQHRRVAAIVVVDLLLGWTVIGWVWAMAWSLTYDLHGSNRTGTSDGSSIGRHQGGRDSPRAN